MKHSKSVPNKHSTGELVGSQTSLIIVPIVVAAGYTMPKLSTRNTVSPAGTIDIMGVLCPVVFSEEHRMNIVESTGGCIVWNGNMVVPSDDLNHLLGKKISSGATHLVVDIPFGPSLQVTHLNEAQKISDVCTQLGETLGLEISIDIHHILEPAGFSVGPNLEARDVLNLLQRRADRPFALETKALRLAGKLLDLINSDPKSHHGEALAKDILYSGKAWKTMQDIIHAQGGDKDITASDIPLGHHHMEISSDTHGTITSLNMKALATIARILGCPEDTTAGIYLTKRIDEHIDSNDILCILYSSDPWKLKEAKETLNMIPIYTIS